MPDTPFYVESGGAGVGHGIRHRTRGDTDNIIWEIAIDDTRKPVPGLIVHVGGDQRDAAGRPLLGRGGLRSTARHHAQSHRTPRPAPRAAHLLGEHVQQAGSVVIDRLRFDFIAFVDALTQDELDVIEEGVNAVILEDYPVNTEQMGYKQAVSGGATAFTEKYGDEVRAIEIGWEDEMYSKELCGGTHVAHRRACALSTSSPRRASAQRQAHRGGHRPGSAGRASGCACWSRRRPSCGCRSSRSIAPSATSTRTCRRPTRRAPGSRRSWPCSRPISSAASSVRPRR